MRMGQGVRTALGHGASPMSYRHNFLVNYNSLNSLIADGNSDPNRANL